VSGVKDVNEEVEVRLGLAIASSRGRPGDENTADSRGPDGRGNGTEPAATAWAARKPCCTPKETTFDARRLSRSEPSCALRPEENSTSSLQTGSFPDPQKRHTEARRVPLGLSSAALVAVERFPCGMGREMRNSEGQTERGSQRREADSAARRCVDRGA